MIRAKKARNTKHFMHNGEAYCEYCGQKITPDCESDHYEVIKYYHCVCDDAIKQNDIRGLGIMIDEAYIFFEFCYKHHIDFLDLIEMGLANDATGKNIY